MESDGRYMMENNYRYSLELLRWCQAPKRSRSSMRPRPRSTAPGACSARSAQYEAPLNVYGYSKFLFDQVVRTRCRATTPRRSSGLRYFNVYGPREAHKGRMASVAFHFFNQYLAEGRVRAVRGQRRLRSRRAEARFRVRGGRRWRSISTSSTIPEVSGIFNVGTGRAQSFNEVARGHDQQRARVAGRGGTDAGRDPLRAMIEYVPFPAGLKEKYQSFTQADLGLLRRAGYTAPFLSVEEGVRRYVDWLLAQ